MAPRPSQLLTLYTLCHCSHSCSDKVCCADSNTCCPAQYPVCSGSQCSSADGLSSVPAFIHGKNASLAFLHR